MVPAPPLEPVRTWPLALCAAGPVFLALVLLLPSWPAGLFYDDGIYLVLGRAIATGHGLSYLNLPGDPAATHFPPLYPALLALLWHLSDSVETVSTLSRVLNALLYAGFTGLLAVTTHRVTTVRPMAACVLATLAVMATPLVTLALLALSEPLFLFLVLPALWAAERARTPGASPQAAVVAGLLAGLTYLTRSAALPILAAAVVVYAAQRRWRTLAGYLLGAAPLVLGWHLWVAAADSTVPATLGPNYGSYASWYGGAAAMPPLELAWRATVLNLVRVPEVLGSLVTPAPLASLTLATGIALLALLARGGLRLAPTHPVAALALLGYLGIVLVWPFNPARFIQTVWPLLLPALLLGAGVGRAPGRTLVSVASRGVAGVLGIGYLISQGGAFATGSWNLPHRQAAARLVPTLLWVQEYTTPGQLVATGLDPAVYLYTGRKAIPPSSWASSDYVRPLDARILAERLWVMAETFRPDYIIIQHRLNQLHVGVNYLLEVHPGRLIPVAELEDGTRVLAPAADQSSR